MLTQGAGETGAGKEFGRLAVILRRGASHDLFERNRELVRVE